MNPSLESDHEFYIEETFGMLDTINGQEAPILCGYNRYNYMDDPPLLLWDEENSCDAKTDGLEWTNVDEDMLKALIANNPGKNWKYIANFFPYHPKVHIKKRFLAHLRKGKHSKKKPVSPKSTSRIARRVLQSLSKPAEEIPHFQTSTERIKCLAALKDRLSNFETDLLGSCVKIKDILKKEEDNLN